MSGAVRRGRLAGFAAAEGGVSAVEFSLIAPLLLAMFMASIEIPRAFAIARRLDQAASTMADLISRGQYADLSDVYAAAAAVANPYDTSRASIVLTAAGTYQSGLSVVAKVCSGAQQNGQARTVGSAIGPPPLGMSSVGDRFVMAEVKMRYVSIFPLFSTLAGWEFSYAKSWPVRDGKAVYGQPEVILPGGQACPLAVPPA